jgi:flagellar protein FliJ
MTAMHSKRLEPLHAVARAREDGAVQRYVARQEHLRTHERKLAQLESYLDDYTRATPRAAAAAQLRVRREFIEQLRRVIQMEAGVVADARAACEAERANWLLAHRDTEVLDKLAARYRAGEARVAETRAQRETDEIAVQRWVRSRPA